MTNEKRQYTFNFKGGPITVRAFNYEQAKILAQAEAIKRGWDYTIITISEICPKNENKKYRIYYKHKNTGICQKIDEVFNDSFDANQRCFWLNEHSVEGMYGQFIYKEESK